MIETLPRDNRHPPWLDRRQFPFTSRFVEIEGHRVHYVDEGSGATLLFLHGNPTWSFLYRHIIAELKADFRCVAVDYPGFGLSEAAAGYGFTPQEHAWVIEEFINQLDLQEIILFVHDWGGPIGLGVAGKQPQRFRGFAIANTFAWAVDDNLLLAGFSRFFGGALGGVLIRRFNAFVNWIIPVGIQRQCCDRVLMHHYRAPFPTPSSREPTHIFAREILKSDLFLQQVSQSLSRLADKPALILWGDRDPAFRASQRLRFQQVFQKSKTVILSGAGHFVQEDAVNQIVEALRFLFKHHCRDAPWRVST
ncbi:MAG: alpha/beta fold hydrolase [Coleofasciculus sp. B1-GNL1-01]|uniref:alpha/beta fold hydrolase n=1 Tax=Coleofasciculus sp. B1-GNL1-01 TaxID=3068484 RepID=UPI0032F838A7